LIVAIDIERYGDTGSKSALCGQSVHITNPANGQSVTAVIAYVTQHFSYLTHSNVSIVMSAPLATTETPLIFPSQHSRLSLTSVLDIWPSNGTLSKMFTSSQDDEAPPSRFLQRNPLIIIPIPSLDYFDRSSPPPSSFWCPRGHSHPPHSKYGSRIHSIRWWSPLYLFLCGLWIDSTPLLWCVESLEQFCVELPGNRLDKPRKLPLTR